MNRTQRVIHEDFKKITYHVRKDRHHTLLNVAGALQRSKDILRKAKVP